MKIGVIARYLILLVSILIYIGSCNSDVMNSAQKKGLIPDDYRFGDLYRMANLPQFKALQIPCPPAYPADSPRKPIHLYIIGDSFSEPPRVTLKDFPIDYFHRTKWGFDRRVQLDTTKTNTLIIETVERHFRNQFGKYITDLKVVSDTTRAEPQPQNRLTWQQITKEMETLFSRDAVEGRLETILFFTDWALWFKDLKAWLTLDWFGRVNPRTTLTPDGQHLLYYMDTDTSLINSSFKPISDSLLNHYIDTINVVADRYKKAGFDHVYLSIIPNKTSIYAPGMGPLPYNHLIERVQQSPRLTIPAIDVYTPYKASRVPLYETSDAHWNCEGRAIWMREVTKRLNADTP
ncbi:hypothetical protein GCM10028803_26310 [Larkinella knui]|uniref:AlgX/AlgJ SGNH hydrolase-like domain-containing protein n=1 Tax=Larkinella knui TaxID=2025310 RepID=A0A3P1CWG1_9BACT|nr:hypothetical protein [Larkinella knui]RRB17681.1 hypothetical protein EHT87_05205 [Larkinella knui]